MSKEDGKLKLRNYSLVLEDFLFSNNVLKMTQTQWERFLQENSAEVDTVKNWCMETVNFADGMGQVEETAAADFIYRILPREMANIAAELIDGKISLRKYKEKRDELLSQMKKMEKGYAAR